MTDLNRVTPKFNWVNWTLAT